jgi:hypothetical protein
VALTVSNPRCPPAMPVAGQAVAGVFLAPGAPVKPEVAWCVPLPGERYSPIATTVDGKNEALVWFLSGQSLKAVNGETGEVVFNGGAGTCAGVRKWTSPIAARGRIIVGGDGHLCAWSAPQ